MKKSIGLFVRNLEYYAGGNYYAYEVATALLSLGHEVIIYTNLVPTFFVKDFAFVKFTHVVVSTFETQPIDSPMHHDLVIGFPVAGTWRAHEYATKHRIRCLQFVFDALPNIKEQLTPREYEQERLHFSRIESQLKDKQSRIVTCSKYTMEGILRWVNRSAEVLYPCVNDYAIRNKIVDEEDAGILYISRLVERKRFDDLFTLASIYTDTINIVTSTINDNIKRACSQHPNIKIHYRVSDERKFGIISQCDAVISTSKFEGFGMYAIESYAMGKPLIAHDLPTFREITGKKSFFAYTNIREVPDILANIEEDSYINDNYSFAKFTDQVDSLITSI